MNFFNIKIAFRDFQFKIKITNFSVWFLKRIYIMFSVEQKIACSDSEFSHVLYISHAVCSCFHFNLDVLVLN